MVQCILSTVVSFVSLDSCAERDGNSQFIFLSFSFIFIFICSAISLQNDATNESRRASTIIHNLRCNPTFPRPSGGLTPRPPPLCASCFSHQAVIEDALCSEGRIEATFMSPCLTLDTLLQSHFGSRETRSWERIRYISTDTLKVKVRNLPLGCFVQN